MKYRNRWKILVNHVHQFSELHLTTSSLACRNKCESRSCLIFTMMLFFVLCNCNTYYIYIYICLLRIVFVMIGMFIWDLITKIAMRSRLIQYHIPEFGSHFGAIVTVTLVWPFWEPWAPFWGITGVLPGYYWGITGVLLGYYWGITGVLLGYYWGITGVLLDTDAPPGGHLSFQGRLLEGIFYGRAFCMKIGTQNWHKKLSFLDHSTWLKHSK